MKKLLEEKLQAYKEQVDDICVVVPLREFIKIDISVAEESAEAYFEEIQELLKKL